jgi:hypothetical protein
MSMRAPRFLALIILALACANKPDSTRDDVGDLASGRGFTLVNLHPDNERSRLYAVNFQQGGLIPVCSEVEYLGFQSNSFKFRVISWNREYDYVNHKAAGEPFADHLRRFFGPTCPREEINSLSELDRQGLREGRAIEGMTRRGVILAMGHPPRHVNPDPNAAALMYWKNRFNRVEIQFGPTGLVTSIRN